MVQKNDILLKEYFSYPLQVHYIPIHLNSFYMEKYGYKYGDYPNAEKFYKRQLSLPIYPELTNKEVEHVINSLIKIIKL